MSCLYYETCFVSWVAGNAMSASQTTPRVNVPFLQMSIVCPLWINACDEPVCDRKLKEEGAGDRITSERVCDECYIIIVGCYQLQNYPFLQKTPAKWTYAHKSATWTPTPKASFPHWATQHYHHCMQARNSSKAPPVRSGIPCLRMSHLWGMNPSFTASI